VDRDASKLGRVLCRIIPVTLSSALLILPAAGQATSGSIYAQFRAEVFNVFNNVNLNLPNSTQSSPAFGTISGAGAPRIVQLALRISF
jgi:hypothetical protein